MAMHFATSIRTLILLTSILAVAASAGAATYTVLPGGGGDFPTIQVAVDASFDGDIIELGDGTFTGDGNRDVDYLGKAITVRSESGNPDACVIDCQGSETDLHRGFHFHSGEGSLSTLQGVTIANGYAPGPGDYLQRRGGAVCCSCGSSPTINNCVFLDCFAAWGGGVYCRDASSPAISDCVFSGDSSMEYGGGMYCRDGSLPTVTGCVFSGNHGGWGGGLYFHNCSSPTVTDCVFFGNTTEDYMGWGGGMGLWESSPLIDGCTFQENTASDEGGGMTCLRYSSPSIVGCTFVHNQSGWRGGGIYCWEDSCPTLTNCTFSGNGAEAYGGEAFFGEGSHAALENTIFAFSTEGVQALYCDYSNVTLTCCDVYGNAGGDWVGHIADQYGIDGNICEDPQFCDPDNGDFTLHADSPCVPFSPPNPECDLIGAWPVGCGHSPVTETSWGRIKATHRTR
jgi:hypothetical protein